MSRRVRSRIRSVRRAAASVRWPRRQGTRWGSRWRRHGAATRSRSRGSRSTSGPVRSRWPARRSGWWPRRRTGARLAPASSSALREVPEYDRQQRRLLNERCVEYPPEGPFPLGDRIHRARESIKEGIVELAEGFFHAIEPFVIAAEQ